MFLTYFLNDCEIVPGAPIITGITFVVVVIIITTTTTNPPPPRYLYSDVVVVGLAWSEILENRK